MPTTLLPFKPKNSLRNAANRLKRSWNSKPFSDTKITPIAHDFASEVCKAIGIHSIPIRVKHKSTSKANAAMFYYNEGKSKSISMYTKCAQFGKKIPFFDFIGYLIHEIVHHADISYLKKKRTYHTVSFYKRIDHLHKNVCAYLQWE